MTDVDLSKAWLAGELASLASDQDGEALRMNRFAVHRSFAADSAAGDTVAEHVISSRLPVAARIVDARIGPTGAATANGTNFATVTVSKRNGAGGTATDVAELTTESGSWVAFTPVSMTLSSPVLTAGSILTATVGKTASGVQLPAFQVQITLEAI